MPVIAVVLVSVASALAADALLDPDKRRALGRRIRAFRRLRARRRTTWVWASEGCGLAGVSYNPDRERRQGQWLAELLDEQGARGDQPHGRGRRRQRGPVDASPWTAEPDVGRVVDGVAAGLDLARASRRSRLRATGNGCVPHQAAAAFISLAEALR